MICEYGCGQEAKHRFKNGKFCCSEYITQCPKRRRIIGEHSWWRNASHEKILNRNKKISESMKGKIPDEETRKKMSLAKLGHIPWNKNTKKIYYCIDCGNKVSDKHTKRCRICFEKGGKEKKYYCLGCGKEMSRGSKRCQKCYFKIMSRGPNHHWWTETKRPSIYPKGFFEKRKEIEKHNCPICTLEGQSILGECLHHIDYDKTNNRRKNLIFLCKSDHSKTNYNREYWKKLLRKINEIIVGIKPICLGSHIEIRGGM